ncbi:MAG: hypothetical protein ACKV19_21015 [Verrucomicrobiales bacterium]
MRLTTLRLGLPLALATHPATAAATEAPLYAWLEQEAGGLLYLHTATDLGRAYQVEWSTRLETSDWKPALPRPVEGTNGRQAFYLGQWPDFDGPPPQHPLRLDFAIIAYSDGTSLAQWSDAAGTIVRRRVPLDFRKVPRSAGAAVTDATVVTRTQVSEAPAVLPTTTGPDPDPAVRDALDSLAEAYPLLQFSQPDSVIRQAAESGALTGTRFWRVRRLERDADADGLRDFQEWQSLQTNPMDLDSDGDGASDAAEVTAGTPPLDFFDGHRPSLVQLPTRWGDVPYTGPNEWLTEPLVLEVRKPDGTPWANAPVTAAASAGGLTLWRTPLDLRSAIPILSARCDASGRLALAWRSDAAAGPASIVHAWSGEGMAYQGLHRLVHTLRALSGPDPTVLAWLRADAEVEVGEEGRVASWSDEARSVTATASGAQRPLLNGAGPLPLIQFNGTHRLDLGTPRGGSSMSALFVAEPAAPRSQPPVTPADPANRTPGLVGQRYLLAGDVVASASPWRYTPHVPRQLRTTQYFSRYTALFFTVDLVYNIRGYNCREITYTFGYLPPSLPNSQVPSVRYDITSGAIPDPGPPNRQRGNTYRLNPGLPNCPLKSGASLNTCLNDFITRRNLPTTYEWETRQLATYTRRAGNPVTEDFSEIYYETKGYSPEVPEQFELQAGSIGNVGQGLSAGTNSTGYFHLSQHFAPALGSSPASPNLTLTSVVISNGRPAFFTNGKSSGSSAAPAGGTALGFRFLGALADGSNGFSGTLGDLLLTSGALTDDARRSLEDLVADRRRLTQVDRDADAMPDWWERRCLAAGTAAAPTGNPDADGLTNTQERARFTLPEFADSDLDGSNDGAESAAAAITPDTDHDGFLDGVDPTPTNPANGRADANGNGLPDGLDSLLAAPMQRDSDGDSLPDLTESIVSQTNPLTPDTDGDSLPDAWEFTHQLDPNDPAGLNGPAGDTDEDGKSNAQEFALGTHPRIPD